MYCIFFSGNAKINALALKWLAPLCLSSFRIGKFLYVTFLANTWYSIILRFFSLLFFFQISKRDTFVISHNHFQQWETPTSCSGNLQFWIENSIKTFGRTIWQKKSKFLPTYLYSSVPTSYLHKPLWIKAYVKACLLFLWSLFYDFLKVFMCPFVFPLCIGRNFCCILFLIFFSFYVFVVVGNETPFFV